MYLANRGAIANFNLLAARRARTIQRIGNGLSSQLISIIFRPKASKKPFVYILLSLPLRGVISATTACIFRNVVLGRSSKPRPLTIPSLNAQVSDRPQTSKAHPCESRWNPPNRVRLAISLWRTCSILSVMSETTMSRSRGLAEAPKIIRSLRAPPNKNADLASF